MSLLQSLPTNAGLYHGLKVTLKIKQRRMRLAGHCIWRDDETANKLVLWQPTEGRKNRAKRKITYVDVFLSPFPSLSVYLCSAINYNVDDYV